MVLFINLVLQLLLESALGEARFEIVRLFVRKDIVSLNLQECLPVEWRYDRANIEECLLDCGVDSISAHLFANQLIDTEE